MITIRIFIFRMFITRMRITRQITEAAANGLQPHKLSVEKLLFLENKNKTLVTAVLTPTYPSQVF
jgi:hypothetical protein